VFSRAGFRDGIERFNIERLVDVVFSREAGNKLGFMLGHPPRGIVSNGHIQRSVSFARENVYEERCADLCTGPRFVTVLALKPRWVPALRRVTLCRAASGTRVPPFFKMIAVWHFLINLQ
jgi:hypothetical protein